MREPDIFYGWVPHDNCPKCSEKHRLELLGWYWVKYDTPNGTMIGPFPSKEKAQKRSPLT